MKTFRVPDLAEGLEEVEIVTWHVSAGDRVVGGQPLVSVETDKAVVEVTAPQAGLVAKTFGSAGDRLKVGAPLLEFDGEGRADTGTVVGEIPSEPAAVAAHVELGGRRSPATGIRAAPAVRALARRLDVDLADVSPTGPEESVTVADVEHASRDRGPPEGFEPLRGVRLAMARNMARAHEQVVPATMYSDADVQAWGAETDVMIRLIQAVVAGSAAEPALNAWLRGSDLARRVHDQVDLAVAIDTKHGLFAPVLRDAESKSEAQLRSSLDALREQADSRTLAPEALRGGDVHALELRLAWRPLRRARGRAAPGRNPGRGTRKTRGRARRRRARGASATPALPDLRPPGSDRRRGYPFSSGGDRTSRARLSQEEPDNGGRVSLRR